MVFLHYNEKGGKFDIPFDGRPLLGMSSEYRSQEALALNESISHNDEGNNIKKIIY